MTLSNNLFIIFGSSQGLGKALYEHCSQFKENDLIIINRKSVNQAGVKTKKITIDLSKKINHQQLSKLFVLINNKSDYQNIYLINNASIIEPIKPIGQVNNQSLVNAVYVNFLNYTIIINEFIGRTAQFKAHKKILNITSGAAASAHYGLAAYCATKSALEMFGQCIYLEQQKLKQVKILNLRPAVINTPMQAKMRSSLKQDFAEADIYQKLFKTKKLLEPKDVAQKIYKILIRNKYWVKPTLNINEIL